ncbi:MAG TPA: type II toxin-antitoxin system Phd/YefM family antitoxin [Nitrospirota bacterium]|nr:type II toxin-antitoxin system Phd/YefM family antitoxin [Nitrospirota bacterium]
MRMSEAVKPISFLKAHASEIIRGIAERKGPVVITLNGEAKAVLQDIRDYEKTQESLALLKMLAQARAGLEAGQVKPAEETFQQLKEKAAELVCK